MCVVERVAVHVALRLCVSLTSFKVQFIAIVVTIAQHQITNNQVVLIVRRSSYLFLLNLTKIDI